MPVSFKSQVTFLDCLANINFICWDVYYCINYCRHHKWGLDFSVQKCLNYISKLKFAVYIFCCIFEFSKCFFADDSFVYEFFVPGMTLLPVCLLFVNQSIAFEVSFSSGELKLIFDLSWFLIWLRCVVFILFQLFHSFGDPAFACFFIRDFDAVCWLFPSGCMMCGQQKVDVFVCDVLFEDCSLSLCWFQRDEK